MSVDGPRPRFDTLDPRNFPPGIVGVIGAELARYHLFTHSLISLGTMLPPGSGQMIQCSADVCGNLNQICRRVLTSIPGVPDAEWVWIMGDDHVFKPDIVLRLLQHDVDIVVPHCLKRVPGWEPVVYSHQDDEGWYHIAELPERGLTRVHAAGSAGMLIRRNVLEEIGDPWFTPGPLGLAEDVEFCKKAREAGFDIHCDPEILLGHISIHNVWPSYRNGRWHIDLEHNMAVTVPMTRLTGDYEPVKLLPVEDEVLA